MPDLASIISFFEAHTLAAYAVLFAMMIVEGETFLIISGVLSQLGALNLFYVIPIAFAGTMIGDALWYTLGVILKHKNVPPFISQMIDVAERVVHKLLPHFAAKPFASLVLAKFIYGTNHATLVLSGMMRIGFMRFMKIEAVATTIWVLVFSTLGYILGYAAIKISERVSIFFLLVLIFIVSFMAAQRYVSFYYENKKDKI
ncbi:MAG: VTT domain-containing protein [Patescibacteria group bacterium]